MKYLRIVLCLLLCLALTGVPVVGQSKAAKASPKAITIPFRDVKLKNGLRVILSEDHAAPTVAISTTYNVGSRDERPGRTGFAHLFEHMMFQGSENVGKGEHFILVLNNGGGMNGTTNTDRTNYFQTLPANQIDLGLFLEADRMRSLDISQANLDNQRHAVQEERRLRVDNQPYGKTFEKIAELAYDNFAYKHSTIGSMEDLNAASVQDVAQFFKTYYAPNNAVLVLVGDFKTQEALAKVKKYFEAIPAQPAADEPDMSEPPRTEERRATIEDEFARLPRIDLVYKVPPSNTPDWYALDVLGDILGSGQSSRLNQTLVREKELALNAGGGAQLRRGPSLFSVVALARPGKKLEDLERALEEEIEKIKSEPVADWELQKILMQTRRQQAQSAYSTLGRANLLGQFAVYFGDPSLVNRLEDIYAKVTKEDIQRVARKYLVPANRTVVITMPKAQPGRPGRPSGSQ